VINLENDNPDSEDPARILKVIETVNSPYLRSLPDFCNSMQIHDDAEYNARSLAALFPHAFNISHVKDVEIVDGKSLRVDVDAIFAIAKKAKLPRLLLHGNRRLARSLRWQQAIDRRRGQESFLTTVTQCSRSRY